MTTPDNVVQFPTNEVYDAFRTVSFISASSLGSVYDKPALSKWAVDATVDAILGNLPWVASSVEQGNAAAVRKWAQGARYENRDPAVGGYSATRIGTAVHAYLENGLTGRPIPDEDALVLRAPAAVALCDRVRELAQRANLQAVAAEQVVVNQELGYAGRGDLWATSSLWEGTSVVDLKTSATTHTASGRRKAVYVDGYALQLGAYDLAPTVAPEGVPHTVDGGGWGPRYYSFQSTALDQLVPAPETNGVAYVLHATPERAQLVPVTITPAIVEGVRATVAAAHWLYQEAKRLPAKSVLTVDAPKAAA